MRIVRALVEQIGGELRIGRADKNRGARFTVLFHDCGTRRVLPPEK
jgi:two-component sensor histidine kinase